MNQMAPGGILKAFDHALEASSRWPRLLLALGFDTQPGRPGAVLLNDALEARGFGRVLDERERFLRNGPDYPDAWWPVIAKAVAGRDDAAVDQVVAALQART